MRASTTIAAAALALAPTVAATGKAVVKNKCNFPVYLWSVANTDGEMHTLDASSGEYSEQYRENPNGGGVSIKMALEQNPYTASVAQFEYTLGNTLWYDLSDINGNPFMKWGYSLEPSESGCRKVACAPGQANCDAVYNVPEDNHATAACSNDANTVLELCSDNGSDNGNSATPAAPAPGAGFTPLASIVNNVLPQAETPKVNVAAVPAPQAAPPAQAPAPSEAPAPAPAAAEPAVQVFTTFVTVPGNPAPAAAAPTPATPAPDAASPVSSAVSQSSQGEWFGHHLAADGWNYHPSKKVVGRHEHHPGHIHAASQQ